MAQVEVVVGALTDVVRLAQERGDVLLGAIDDGRGGGAAHDVVEPGLALDLLHDRRVGHDDRVVLILARRRLPLHVEHADHRARLLLDADLLADRILGPEQLIDDGLAEQADGGRPLDVGVGEDAAAHDRPALYLQVRRRDAAHRRVPVLVAVDELHARVDVGRDVGDERNPLLHRADVLEAQRLGAVRPGPDAAAVHAARLDPDHVRADARDGLLDARRRAVADGDRADHRADADDDAERGERAPHRVLANGLERHALDREKVHETTRSGVEYDTLAAFTRLPRPTDAITCGETDVRRGGLDRDRSPPAPSSSPQKNASPTGAPPCARFDVRAREAADAARRHPRRTAGVRRGGPGRRVLDAEGRRHRRQHDADDCRAAAGGAERRSALGAQRGGRHGQRFQFHRHARPRLHQVRADADGRRRRLHRGRRNSRQRLASGRGSARGRASGGRGGRGRRAAPGSVRRGRRGRVRGPGHRAARAGRPSARGRCRHGAVAERAGGRPARRRAEDARRRQPPRPRRRRRSRRPARRAAPSRRSSRPRPNSAATSAASRISMD